MHVIDRKPLRKNHYEPGVRREGSGKVGGRPRAVTCPRSSMRTRSPGLTNSRGDQPLVDLRVFEEQGKNSLLPDAQQSVRIDHRKTDKRAIPLWIPAAVRSRTTAHLLLMLGEE